MRATGWLRRNRVETLWGVFALANLAAMFVWPDWTRLPFYLIWVSLTLVYGLRLWSTAAAGVVLLAVSSGVIAVVLVDGFKGDELSGKLISVPFLAALFAMMVWHLRRRAAVLREVEAVANGRADMLEQQRQFLHDASHELRTPVTIARGHLELLRRQEVQTPELDVALDELERIEQIIGRLLLLAQAEQQQFLVRVDVDVETFLIDVFMRWSEVAARAWRLDVDIAGVIRADAEGLREALDALLENAVKYTETGDRIELRAWAAGGEIVIAVVDDGCGVPEDALARIFERFARADGSRTRSAGGVGLGLAIVDAIAQAHGWRCSVERRIRGTAFALHIPVGRDLAGAEAPVGRPPVYSVSSAARSDAT